MSLLDQRLMLLQDQQLDHLLVVHCLTNTESSIVGITCAMAGANDRFHILSRLLPCLGQPLHEQLCLSVLQVYGSLSHRFNAGSLARLAMQGGSL